MWGGTSMNCSSSKAWTSITRIGAKMSQTTPSLPSLPLKSARRIESSSESPAAPKSDKP